MPLRPRRLGSMWKILAGVLLAVSVIFASVQWILLYKALGAALAPLGLGVVEGLGLGEPAVEQATVSTLQDLAHPRAVLRWYGATRLFLLLSVGAGVVVVWLKADLGSEALRGRTLFAGLIGLPTILGLALTAGPGARAGVRNLREAGLTNPDLVGAGVADVYGIVLMGLVLGAVLAIVFLGLLRRARH